MHQTWVYEYIVRCISVTTVVILADKNSKNNDTEIEIRIQRLTMSYIVLHELSYCYLGLRKLTKRVYEHSNQIQLKIPKITISGLSFPESFV